VTLKSDEPFNPDIARAMVALDRNSARLTEAYLESLKRVEKAQVDVALASMRQKTPPPRIDEATISDAEVFAPFAATAMPAVTVSTVKDVAVNTLPKSWKASRLIGGSAAPDAATIKLVAENFAYQLTKELSELSINTALKIEIDALKKRATEVRALQKDFDEEIKKRREQLDKTMNNFVQALSTLANITGGSAASAILSNLPEGISGVWAGVGPGQSLDSALTSITKILLLAAQTLADDINRVKIVMGEVRSLEEAAAAIRQLNAKVAAAENARVEASNLRGIAERQAAEFREYNARGNEELKKAKEEIENLKRGLRDTTATVADLENRLKACEELQQVKDAEKATLEEELKKFSAELLAIRVRTQTEDAEAATKSAEESARRLQELEETRSQETKALRQYLDEALVQERKRALEALTVAIRTGDLDAVADIAAAVERRDYGPEVAEIQKTVNDFARFKALTGRKYEVYSKRLLDAIRVAANNKAEPYTYKIDPYLLGRIQLLTEILALLASPGKDVAARVRQLANDPSNAEYSAEIADIAKSLDTFVEVNATNQDQASNLLATIVEDVKKAIVTSVPYRWKPKETRPVESDDLRSDTRTSGLTGAKRYGSVEGTVDTKNSINAGKEESISDAEETPSTESIREPEEDEKK
jgi:hypothetical protein